MGKGVTGGREFHGSAIRYGNLHRVLVTIIQSPGPKSEANLFEVVYAIDSLGITAVLSPKGEGYKRH
jgi:hypothetical protein